MKRAVSGLVCLLAVGVPLQQAGAWYRANAWGGHTTWGGGSWSHEGFRGGTASGGGGSWNATGWRGGTASGGYAGWHGTGPAGRTAYGDYGRYYGRYYRAYHPPTVVNHYYGAGCYNCGGWGTGGAIAAGLTGLAVGTAAGAAVANANTAAATSSAYNAGVAAGVASAGMYPIGGVYSVLPTGCAYSLHTGDAYYRCGGSWFRPNYGANGVYYTVVAAP
jgi:hypothetical protein